VIDYRCPLEIEGVGVSPGDLVFGDVDGVVVIPRRVENEVVTKSLEKARDEKVVRREIEAGPPTADVFSRYGIL
jgi:4-hydroxy-4-methyl-2-oxoglutarate aldolase